MEHIRGCCSMIAVVEAMPNSTPRSKYNSCHINERVSYACETGRAIKLARIWWSIYTIKLLYGLPLFHS
jgi:hypothetical protein